VVNWYGLCNFDIKFVQLLNVHFITFSHDVAEIAGLISHSFGTEGVDKYLILYKKVMPLGKVLNLGS